jgi:hypothetical protein
MCPEVVSLSTGRLGIRHPKNGYLRTDASAFKERMLNAPSQRLKIRELGTPKHIWIAEAMLQLCYHKGASMACALQKRGVGSPGIWE